MNAQTKLDRAKVWVVNNLPFFAFIMIHMEWVLSEGVGTACTNGETVWFDPDFIHELSDSELKGVIVHETMHVILKHHLRRGERDIERWNHATDYIINELIDKDVISKYRGRVALPTWVLRDSKYHGMTADKVYALIGQDDKDDEQDSEDKQEEQDDDSKDGNGSEGNEDSDKDDDDEQDDNGDGENGSNDTSENGDNKDGGNNGDDKEGSEDSNGSESGSEGSEEQDGGGSSAGQGSDVDSEPASDPGRCGGVIDAPQASNPVERKEAEDQMDVQVLQAASFAKKQGTMPGFAEGLLDEIREPVLDWRELLSEFFIAKMPNDYSFRRLSRNYLYQDMYVPGMYEETLGKIAVIDDTSGSTHMYQQRFTEQLNGIFEQCQPELIRVYYVDTRVQLMEEFNQGEEMRLKRIDGGGTYFSPAFDAMREEGFVPDCCVYLTDMYSTDYPKIEPDYPVLWVSCTRPSETHDAMGYGYNWHNPPFGEVIYMDLDD